jgi:hypothetical protein
MEWMTLAHVLSHRCIYNIFLPSLPVSHNFGVDMVTVKSAGGMFDDGSSLRVQFILVILWPSARYVEKAGRGPISRPFVQCFHILF